MTAPGVGIVGAGRISDLHAIAIRAAGGELRGIVSSTEERTRLAADRLHVADTFRSVAALAASPGIDIVHVTSPTGLHAAHASAVIAAGKHLVCEKPLATSLAEAERMASDAREVGVVGTVAFSYRFHAAVLEARARVRDGDIGSLLSVRGRYLQDWLLLAGADEWRLDSRIGGPSRAWADIGSHLVDLIEFISGDRLSRVAAVARQHVSSAATESTSSDDAIAVSAELLSGAIATLSVSQVDAGRRNALAVSLSGEDGALSVDLERAQELWIGSPGASDILTSAELARGVRDAGFVPEGGMGDIVSAFSTFVHDSYALMRGELRPLVPTLDDGVRAALVTEAVLAAAHSQRWVATV